MTAKIEFLQMVSKFCQTVRRTKARPDLALQAAEWELKLGAEIKAAAEDEKTGCEEEQAA